MITEQQKEGGGVEGLAGQGLSLTGAGARGEAREASGDRYGLRSRYLPAPTAPALTGRCPAQALRRFSWAPSSAAGRRRGGVRLQPCPAKLPTPPPSFCCSVIILTIYGTPHLHHARSGAVVLMSIYTLVKNPGWIWKSSSSWAFECSSRIRK